MSLEVETEILNIVHVQCSLHLLKAGTTMDNIFLSHSYTLVFSPKSLFSITLILICITLSLVTLLGNHFSFHFIALRYKRNVIFLCLKQENWMCDVSDILWCFIIPSFKSQSLLATMSVNNELKLSASTPCSPIQCCSWLELFVQHWMGKEGAWNFTRTTDLWEVVLFSTMFSTLLSLIVAH